ncbi:MAG: zinc ribbon domain-containing protein [Tepidisphaeraceae bacterium]
METIRGNAAGAGVLRGRRGSGRLFVVPIYEYACKSCQTRFEHLARTMSSADDGAALKCPQCGSGKTERALSVFAVGADSPRGKSSSPSASGSGCGRCGGPGPCASGY